MSRNANNPIVMLLDRQPVVGVYDNAPGLVQHQTAFTVRKGEPPDDARILEFDGVSVYISKARLSELACAILQSESES
jgi:hypothetical protein